MIIKKMRGRGFRGVLAYALNDKQDGQENRAEIIGGNMSGQSVAELSKEFRQLRQLKPNAKNPVRHFAIRLSPKDQALTDGQWNQLANRFCDQFGYDSYRLFVLHRDSHPPHLHIITSQIRFDGKLNREYKDIARIKGFCRGTERAMGLQSVSSKATGHSKLYHVRQRGTCKVDAAIRQQKFQSLLKTPAPKSQQSVLVPSRLKTDPVQAKAQAFISNVLSAAKGNGKWLELVKTEGHLLAQIHNIKALLIKAKGTAHEQALAAQLADLEIALANNLAAKIQAWNDEAEQEQRHREQLRRRPKL